MAKKKNAAASRNGRDSNPKMLGVKIYGGQIVKSGNIIECQAPRARSTIYRSEALVCIPERTLEWGGTTRCSRLRPGE